MWRLAEPAWSHEGISSSHPALPSGQPLRPAASLEKVFGASLTWNEDPKRLDGPSLKLGGLLNMIQL